MNLRQFLNAAYAILLEEWTRVGVSLEEALTNMAAWREGGPPEEAPVSTTPNAEEQMRLLLSGVKGAPV